MQHFENGAGWVAGAREPALEPSAVAPPAYVAGFSGKEPECEPTAPPDADLSSLLPKATLYGLFHKSIC